MEAGTRTFLIEHDLSVKEISFKGLILELFNFAVDELPEVLEVK